MILLYFIIGFVAALLAALPPGAANIAVVNTSLDASLKKALLIILGAAIGEVLISFIVLHCTMSLAAFFNENPWVQIMVFLAFLVIGIFFLVRDRFMNNTTTFRFPISNKFLKGLLLAIINPPVLIFWVVAFTLTQKYLLSLSEMSPFFVLLLFFLGVFAGKVTVLYGYGSWGKKLEERKFGDKKGVHQFIGIALVVIGVAQSVRFFIES